MPKQMEVASKFHDSLSAQRNFYRDLVLATMELGNRASLETSLAEQLALSSCVLWEAFISDLLIAYVIENPRTAARSFRERILKSVEDRYGVTASKSTKFLIQKPISKKWIAGLLDPNQMNISVNSAKKLSGKANEILAAKHARKFSLNAEDSDFFDYNVSLRNYLAHRSPASRESFNDAVANLGGGKNSDLVPTSKFRKVGSYLKEKGSNGHARAFVITLRFDEIAKKLT